MKHTELTQNPQTKRFIVQGNFLDIGTPNQDGLAFSRESMEWLVNDERFQDCLARRVFPAYIEHPAENIVGFKGTEAGILVKAEIRGDEFFGAIELLDTDEGNFIRDLYQHDVKIGVSIRADGYTDTGSVPGTTKGPIQFYGFDFVAEPAFKYAIPTKLSASRKYFTQSKLRLSDGAEYLAQKRQRALGELFYNLLNSK